MQHLGSYLDNIRLYNCSPSDCSVYSMSTEHHQALQSTHQRKILLGTHTQGISSIERQERILHLKIIKCHNHNSHELSENEMDNNVLREWAKKAIKKSFQRKMSLGIYKSFYGSQLIFLYIYLQLKLVKSKDCIHKLLARNINLFIYIQEAKYITVIYQYRNDISEIQEEYSQARSQSVFPIVPKTQSISLISFYIPQTVRCLKVKFHMYRRNSTTWARLFIVNYFLYNLHCMKNLASIRQLYDVILSYFFYLTPQSNTAQGKIVSCPEQLKS